MYLSPEAQEADEDQASVSDPDPYGYDDEAPMSDTETGFKGVGGIDLE